MTTGEKYSKVLTVSKKKAYKAEDLCRFGRNTISNAIKENRLLSEEYHKIFMTVMGVNPEWWNTGKGEILLKNGTHADIKPAVKGNAFDLGEAIRLIVEGSEYYVIPKVALEGKYRLMPLEELTMKEKELERKAQDLIRRNDQIEGLYEIVKVMASKLPDAAKIQEAQKNTSV